MSSDYKQPISVGSSFFSLLAISFFQAISPEADVSESEGMPGCTFSKRQGG